MAAVESPLPSEPKSTSPANGLIIAAVIAGILYAAREVLVPLALAILMSFVLAPLVRKLQRWKLGKGLSVALVVIFAFAVVFGLAGFMGQQLTQLAGNLPQYQTTITRKVQEANELVSGPGALSRLSQLFQHVNKELAGTKPPQGEAKAPEAGSAAPSPSSAPDRTPTSLPQGGLAPDAPQPVRPIPVEVHQPDQGSMETVVGLLGPLIHPIATTGLVIVFVIFMLLQRQDLRNRMIRLAGSQDLHRTTAALDDAARRLSRLYLMQLALNAGFGVVIGLGLAVIGVPSPFLWGVIAAIFRFVPYIGSLLSAVFPILLAVAVDPGWSMALWAALLFAVTEPILGHLIEPMVQGQSTGLSPIAIVISAAVWTWLWGPIGLVLSTPLTVCLVVLGRHIDALQSLDVMFGDRPPLSPGETFYQRMLARDPLEAADQAENFLEENSPDRYADEVALAGLRLAQGDVGRGALPSARAEDVKHSVLELIDHLENDLGASWYDRLRPGGDDEEIAAAGDRALVVEGLPPSWRGEGAVLCIGGRGPLDEAAAALLAHVLRLGGIGARVEGPEMLTSARLFQLSAEGVAHVCLCYLDQRSEGSVRYAVKRLRRKLPEAGLTVGLWGEMDGLDLDRMRRSVDGVVVTTSIAQSAILIRDAATAQAAEQNSEPAAVSERTGPAATHAA